MNERIKTLRTTLKLSQDNFGQAINVSGSTISAYEVGYRQANDRVISAICSKFNVNPDWLKNGTGEMFAIQDDSPLAKLCSQYNLSPIDMEIIMNYIEMTPKERESLISFMSRLIHKDD